MEVSKASLATRVVTQVFVCPSLFLISSNTLSASPCRRCSSATTPGGRSGYLVKGFKFLGFGVSWRGGRSGRNYPHVEPHPESQMKLREKLREKFNHWTLWRPADEVIPEVNRILKGWSGYFHYANSTRVFDRLNQYAANRVQRWLWRKQGCTKALWERNPWEVLRERHGLYRLPTRAAWTQARA